MVNTNLLKLSHGPQGSPAVDDTEDDSIGVEIVRARPPSENGAKEYSEKEWFCYIKSLTTE